jgi:hypothetical protein
MIERLLIMLAKIVRRHASGRDWLRVLRRAGLIAVGAATVACTEAGPVAAATLNLRCTNPASGANWPVVIDLDHARVGAFPAEISTKWIRWHDPSAGYFDFERATGELRLRNASSTGGYFLRYVCREE